MILKWLKELPTSRNVRAAIAGVEGNAGEVRGELHPRARSWTWWVVMIVPIVGLLIAALWCGWMW